MKCWRLCFKVNSSARIDWKSQWNHEIFPSSINQLTESNRAVNRETRQLAANFRVIDFHSSTKSSNQLAIVSLFLNSYINRKISFLPLCRLCLSSWLSPMLLPSQLMSQLSETQSTTSIRRTTRKSSRNCFWRSCSLRRNSCSDKLFVTNYYNLVNQFFFDNSTQNTCVHAIYTPRHPHVTIDVHDVTCFSSIKPKLFFNFII